MDHKQMRECVMNALDIPQLIDELKTYLNKPSDYTIGETCTVIQRAVMALEILQRKENAEILG